MKSNNIFTESAGLWANIHKKRREGRKMRPAFSKGAPTLQDFKRSAKTQRSQKEDTMLNFLSFFSESTMSWKNEEPVKFIASLEKAFGDADESSASSRVWLNKDGFKRIEVKDEYILHCCPAPHYDFVYSTIDLHVPKQFVRILADSSESILLDLLKNEVTARCATLSANAVTLNYVMDVVAGRVVGSKEEYERRIKALYKNKLEPEFDWWPDTTNELKK